KLGGVVPELLVALKVIGYVPPVPAPGVPLRTPVVVLNVTPVGSVPVSLNVGVGVPGAVTGNVPGVPTVKVVLLALVITGAVFTVRVKLWVAGVPTVLLAVNVMGYIAAVPAAGVPLSVPVPFPLSVKVTPLGSAPVSVRVGVGVPVVVTVNVPAVPTTNVALLALVIAGAWLTVMLSAFVFDWGPVEPTLESVTFTVKLDVPTVVGIPVIAPALLKFRPAGREPVNVNVSPVGPPAPGVAATVWL